MGAPTFGTDGVRGAANTELTPDAALALGRAAVEVLGCSRFVIGRDPRQSGSMLEAALAAGVCSAGADAYFLGVVPTPAVAWVAGRDYIPGAMISASHNPFGDNGIKVFAAGGLKLDDTLEAKIEDRYLALVGDPAGWVGPGGSSVGDIHEWHNEAEGWVDSVCSSTTADLTNVNVVLDCANGASYELGPEVFRRLGVDLHVIGDQPSGVNINDGYGSTAPDLLSKTVVERGASLGLAFDGDADRLIAVDETGAIVDGDRVLGILATDWKRRGQLTDDTVVVTVMTNLGFHRAMAEAEIKVVTTPVGDRAVLAALNEGGFSLGGEQSGHVICREMATTGDGVLAGVQLLDVLTRAKRPLSSMTSQIMTTVPQLLENIRLADRDDTLVDRMGPEIAEVEATFGSDGRVLVRASGTEPLLRVMVEHIDPQVASAATERLVKHARRLVDTPHS